MVVQEEVINTVQHVPGRSHCTRKPSLSRRPPLYPIDMRLSGGAAPLSPLSTLFLIGNMGSNEQRPAACSSHIRMQRILQKTTNGRIVWRWAEVAADGSHGNGSPSRKKFISPCRRAAIGNSKFRNPLRRKVAIRIRRSVWCSSIIGSCIIW